MTTDPYEPTGDTLTDEEKATFEEAERRADDKLQRLERAEPTDKERLWAVLGHIAYIVLPALGPVLILAFQNRILGRESEFLAHHAKQATFWQLAAIVTSIVTCGVSALVMVVWSVFALMAANRGEPYRFPIIGEWVDNL